MPRYNDVQTMRAEVASYNTNLTTATKLEQQRESLIAKYNTINKADLDNVKTLLPDSVDNIRLIIQINSLATKNNLSSLRQVDYNPDDISGKTTANGQAPDPEVQNLPYGEFVISFQTSGQYSNFLSFMSDLEKNLRLVDVTNITFTPNNSSNGVATLASGITYKVTLKTYWLKQ